MEEQHERNIMEDPHGRKITDTIEQLNREGLLNFWKDENDNPATIEKIKENKRRAFEIIDQRLAEEYESRPQDNGMIAKYHQLRNDFDNEFNTRVRAEDIKATTDDSKGHMAAGGGGSLRDFKVTPDNIQIPMAAGGGGGGRGKYSYTGLNVRENAKRLANKIYKAESPLHLRQRIGSLFNSSSVDPNAFNSPAFIGGGGGGGGDGVTGGDVMGAFRSSIFGNKSASTTRRSSNPFDDDVAAANDMSGYKSGGGKKSRRRRLAKRYTNKRRQNRKRRRTARK